VLTNDTKDLFITDSESSAVRKLLLIAGKVSPVVGGDNDPLATLAKISGFLHNVF
jgi:hypothetical protein